MFFSNFLRKTPFFRFDSFVFPRISAGFINFPIYTFRVIIFTFKNLKFSELSKIRKLIHLSFTEEQKKSLSGKITPRQGTSQKTKKAQKHQKNDHPKINLITTNPICQVKNLPGITLSIIMYFILFSLSIFHLFLSYLIYSLFSSYSYLFSFSSYT